MMIAWVGYQRRAETMRDHWGYEICYLPKVFHSRYLLPFDYLIRIVKTVAMIVARRPRVIWMQVPPSFLLYAAFFYKILSAESVVVIDVHNSFLRRKWRSFPFLTRILRHMDAVVVHNQQVRQSYTDVFGDSKHLYVLEDRLIDVAPEPVEREFERAILFPCSFDEDEPIQVVYEVAASLPDVKFFVTGRFDSKVPIEIIKTAPPNVVMTGYLQLAEFDDLLRRSTAVLGLTTRADVQLSVANEALSYGKAMVLSDTPTLRQLFPGSEFVETLEARSISEGIKKVLSDTALYESLTKQSFAQKNQRWEKQAGLLAEVLRG